MSGEFQKIDKEKYGKSLERLNEIFKGISETVTEVSTWRCPYKNAEDRCTAQFGCRNQNRDVPAGQLYICTSSDNLDYRSAWETSE
jgi:hypothetical protein